VVGTGPFMLDRYVPGQRLFLKRNPYYWKKDAQGQSLPYLDRMVFLWVQNIDAMMLKFQTGETDGYGLRGSDYPILKPLEKQGKFKIYELGPNLGTSFITFNQNPGVSKETGKPYIAPYKVKWFRETKFRQAIAHAIDRDALIATIYNGLAQPQYGPLNAGNPAFYNPAVKSYDYDLDEAKKLLAEIGLVDRNGDGVLEDEEGHEVAFTIQTNSGNDQREKTAEIVRKDLQNLGIRVSLDFVEFNLLVQKMDETYDWEALVMSLTGSPDPQDGANIWKSNARLHMWYPRQAHPSTAWEARIDEIFSEGIQEMDPIKRKALYDEWQVIVNEQQPFVYTVAPLMMPAIRDKYENVFPTPIAGSLRQGTTWNIEEIFIKEGYPLE